MTGLRRVVMALALLGVALAVPVAILVTRALRSEAVEQENRHRVLAERVFDEMEGSLSRFLEQEEARPFSAYRVPSADAASGRSPLADPPSLPFVVGYFQIDPDGSLHTPQAPSEAGPEATRELETTLRAAWAGSERVPEIPATRAAGIADERKPASPGLFDVLISPGVTPLLAEDVMPEAALEAKAEQDVEEEASKKDSFALYRSLNRAEERRAERKQKVRIEPLPVEQRPDTRERSEGTEGATMDRDLGSMARAAGPPQVQAPRASRPAPGRTRLAEAAQVVRVALDPMIGRRVGDDRLLLYRTVLVEEQGYRQGLLLDWHALGAWLEREVVEPSALADVARLEFFGVAPLQADGTRAYPHRFAEPFHGFGALLRLAPLPGSNGIGAIHVLAALLAVVALAGGLAIYRMVSVVVQFAERRSRFAASVSHELKTPLTSIRMYAEMLRDGLVPSEQKRDEYYHTITDESERLSRLIDNVLDFSRLEKGEYEIERHRGEVLPVVRRAVEKLAPHCERQGFELVLEAREPLPQVDLDADAVTQVVFNLVDNAVKYARDARRKRIVVGCAPAGTAGVEIRVEDCGPGVPPADLDRIFEPFFRREDDLTRTTKGTGIGLALVKELVESLGGRVEAENAEGGGFRVRVRLGPG